MTDTPSKISGTGPVLHAAPTVAGPSPGESPAAPWPPFDRDDLRRMQAGHPQSLGRFFEHYFHLIFSVARRFAGSLEAAEDITQDVFLKVQRHLGRLDLERDPAPWLYTVVVNACHDHRRSTWWRISRRRVALDHVSVGPGLAGQDRNPEHAVIAAEEERRVQAAISRLAPDLRMSVILHDFEGLSHEQIAGVTRISHAAARKRHSRAILALAKMLRERPTQ